MPLPLWHLVRLSKAVRNATGMKELMCQEWRRLLVKVVGNELCKLIYLCLVYFKRQRVILQTIWLFYHNSHITHNFVRKTIFTTYLYLETWDKHIFSIKLDPTKISDGIFNIPMDFAPASQQENCLHKIFKVSQFAGSNQCVSLRQLLSSVKLDQAMHAGVPKY